MTDKEFIDALKRDWTSSDFYNCEDLNRVELATLLVKKQIGKFRGVVVNIVAVFDRTESSIEFAESLNRIENNILLLKQTFPKEMVFEDSKTDWTHDKPFDFSDANRFERNLYNMYYNIESNISNRPYCGQYTVGQKGVF